MGLELGNPAVLVCKSRRGVRLGNVEDGIEKVWSGPRGDSLESREGHSRRRRVSGKPDCFSGVDQRVHKGHVRSLGKDKVAAHGIDDDKDHFPENGLRETGLIRWLKGGFAWHDDLRGEEARGKKKQPRQLQSCDEKNDEIVQGEQHQKRLTMIRRKESKRKKRRWFS